jgi:2-polyprenyl-3-methyl-5-hydroxy-6-metoxy-1,4-benzoquinol methylase
MDHIYKDKVREDILRMIPPDGTVIGSVGCGRGATEETLVRQGRRVHGVDVSPEAIEVACGRLTSARLISPDQREPFEEGSLDGLILADVIEHIPAAWEALARYAQALRPGGWAVISVPNMRNLKVFMQLFVCGDWPEHLTGIFDATHLQVMTRRRLLRWTDSAGLTLEQWYDAYLSANRADAILKAANLLTLKLLNDWWMVQIQGRFRKAH